MREKKNGTLMNVSAPSYASLRRWVQSRPDSMADDRNPEPQQDLPANPTVFHRRVAPHPEAGEEGRVARGGDECVWPQGTRCRCSPPQRRCIARANLAGVVVLCWHDTLLFISTNSFPSLVFKFLGALQRQCHAAQTRPMRASFPGSAVAVVRQTLSIRYTRK